MLLVKESNYNLMEAIKLSYDFVADELDACEFEEEDSREIIEEKLNRISERISENLVDRKTKAED